MNRFQSEFEPYTDHTGAFIEDWTIARHIEFDYATELCKRFDIDAKPRFYIQKPGFTLPMHIDRGTQCSINVLLYYKNPAPVNIEDKTYYYDACLLNTTKLHGVTTGDEERILFKLSIFNEDYESVARKIVKCIF